jgi:uncharacterized protein
MSVLFLDSSALVKRYITERAYDAVQLAAAQRIHVALRHEKAAPLIFVSADDKLVAAAQAEGFLAENPNLHFDD